MADYGALKSAVVDVSAATNTSVVAAVTNAQIVVTAYQLTSSGAAGLPKFTDGSGGADLTPALPIAVGISESGNRDTPLFATTSGTGLFLNTAGSNRCTGRVTYYTQAAKY